VNYESVVKSLIVEKTHNYEYAFNRSILKENPNYEFVVKSLIVENAKKAPSYEAVVKSLIVGIIPPAHSSAQAFKKFTNLHREKLYTSCTKNSVEQKRG